MTGSEGWGDPQLPPISPGGEGQEVRRPRPPSTCGRGGKGGASGTRIGQGLPGQVSSPSHPGLSRPIREAASVSVGGWAFREGLCFYAPKEM